MVLPPYMPELDESHWHKCMLPAPKRAVLHSDYWDTHGKFYTVSKSMKISVPCPKPRPTTTQGTVSVNTAWKAAQEVTSSLPSFLLGPSPNTRFIKRRYEDPLGKSSTLSKLLVVHCIFSFNLSVVSLQAIRDSNTLIVTPTLDQSKLVTPSLLQQYSTVWWVQTQRRPLHQWCGRTMTKLSWTLGLLAQDSARDCRHSIWENSFFLLHLLPSSRQHCKQWH